MSSATCKANQLWGGSTEIVASLVEICVDKIMLNLPLLSTVDKHGFVHLKPGIVLAPRIAEMIFDRMIQLIRTEQLGFNFSSTFSQRFSLLSNPNLTPLSRLCLNELPIKIDNLKLLLKHKPIELNIVECCKLDTSQTITQINAHSSRLQALFISGHTWFSDVEMDMFPDGSQPDRIIRREGHDYILECPKLQALAMRSFGNREYGDEIITTTVRNLRTLVWLDISECRLTADLMEEVAMLPNLSTLILYDVCYNALGFRETCGYIKTMKRLRVLDLSHSTDDMLYIDDGSEILGDLVAALPQLVCLDISCSNLVGDEPIGLRVRSFLLDHKNSVPLDVQAIPALGNRRFKFLGLLNTSQSACSRPYLPADSVTGTHTEEQILESLAVYLDRCALVQTTLHALFSLVRDNPLKDNYLAVKAVTAVMERHPDELDIQIIASATLYYLTKTEKQSGWGSRLKQRIIGCLVNCMFNQDDETVVLRNCSLTLCNFHIPQDMLFIYDKLACVLIKMVEPVDTEDFVQRIGVYMLNCLACQVEGREKTAVGDAGAIRVMLKLIDTKLEQHKCDEVMETAWSMMWNVTDETPMNCKRFLDEGGMGLFSRCLEHFGDRDDLLRNMMGLLGNIAEVEHLRTHLMKKEYVETFMRLLSSEKDGIEVSYNACGVLAHMTADEGWSLEEPSREDVMKEMTRVVQSWPIKKKRNINYRSFAPILRLVKTSVRPASQIWATWALCNLTKMYKVKYCQLLHSEGGVRLLQELVQAPHVPQFTRDLAQQVLDRCTLVLKNVKFYQDHPNHQSDEENDDEEGDCDCLMDDS